MPSRTKKWFSGVMVHKLAITRFCLFVIGTICASVQASLAGAQWSTLHAQQKLLIVVGILGATCTTIGAFFDKTLSRFGFDPESKISPPPS